MVTNTVVDMEVEKVADELDNYPRTDYGIIKVSTNKNQQYPTWHGGNAWWSYKQTKNISPENGKSKSEEIKILFFEEKLYLRELDKTSDNELLTPAL